MSQVHGANIVSNRQVRVMSTGNLLSSTRTNLPTQSKLSTVEDLSTN